MLLLSNQTRGATGLLVALFAGLLAAARGSTTPSPAKVLVNIQKDKYGTATRFDVHQDLLMKFSRPMVAMGTAEKNVSIPAVLHPEQAGEWRWLNSASLAFRPSPQFDGGKTFTVQLKDGLKDVFGEPFVPATSTWTLRTCDSTIYRLVVLKVISDNASNLTDGAWEMKNIYDGARNAAEVPPDARLVVGISGLNAFDLYSVDPSWMKSIFMRKHTKSSSASSTDRIKVHAEPCNAGDLDESMRDTFETFCAAITATGGSSKHWSLPMPLDVGTEYELVVPRGTNFTGKRKSVVLGEDVVIRVQGLRPFTFPFTFEDGYIDDYPAMNDEYLEDRSSTEPVSGIPDKKMMNVPELHFQRHRLALRHGLAANVTMEMLLAQFDISPKVANLSLKKLDKGAIELSGDFRPEREYKLSVKASDSIMDGFGLPLQASSTTFKMAPLAPVLRSPEFNPRDGVFILRSSSNKEDSAPHAQWPVLFRGKDLCLWGKGDGCAPQREDAVIMESKEDVKAAIKAFLTSQSSSPPPPPPLEIQEDDAEDDAAGEGSSSEGSSSEGSSSEGSSSEGSSGEGSSSEGSSSEGSSSGGAKVQTWSAPLADGVALKKFDVKGSQLHTRWGQTGMKPHLSARPMPYDDVIAYERGDEEVDAEETSNSVAGEATASARSQAKVTAASNAGATTSKPEKVPDNLPRTSFTVSVTDLVVNFMRWNDYRVVMWVLRQVGDTLVPADSLKFEIHTALDSDSDYNPPKDLTMHALGKDGIAELKVQQLRYKGTQYMWVALYEEESADGSATSPAVLVRVPPPRGNGIPRIRPMYEVDDVAYDNVAESVPAVAMMPVTVNAVERVESNVAVAAAASDAEVSSSGGASGEVIEEEVEEPEEHLVDPLPEELQAKRMGGGPAVDPLPGGGPAVDPLPGGGPAVDPMPFPNPAYWRWRVELITDRAAYMPGDTIYIKGYIRNINGLGAGTLESSCRRSLGDSVQVMSDNSLATVSASLNHKYCSFETELPVVDSVKLGGFRTLTVRPDTSASGHRQLVPEMEGEAHVFVIEESKPAVKFHMDCSACKEFGLKPKDNMTLSFKGAVSVAGNELHTPLVGEEINLDWTLYTPCDEDEENDDFLYPVYERAVWRQQGWYEDGHRMCVQWGGRGIQATSDHKGEFGISWVATEHLKRPALAGDILRFRVHARVRISKDGEVHQEQYLEEGHTVYIGTARESLQIGVPDVAVLPQMPFQANIAVKTVERLGAYPLAGKQIKVAVYESKATRGALHNAKLKDLPKGQLVAECPTNLMTDADGNAKSCALTLPRMGQFLVTACDANRDVCSALRVGKKETEWTASPLTHFLPRVVHFSLDKPKYETGEKVVVSFNSPRKNSVLLAAWGNSYTHTHTEQFTLKDNQTKAEIALEKLTAKDGSCPHGCRLVLLLAAPADPSNTVPVPTAHLFDPKMPEYVSATLNVIVHSTEHPHPQPLNVSVTTQSGVAGSKQKLKVELKDNKGSYTSGEVCIFAVEQKMLDVKKHDLTDLSALSRRPDYMYTNIKRPQYYRDDARMMAPQWGGGGQRWDLQLEKVEVRSSIDRLVSEEVLNNVTAWMEKIVEVDPYLLDYVRWPLRSDDELLLEAHRGGWRPHHQVVDVESSIAEVLDSFYDVLTARDILFDDHLKEPYHQAYRRIEDWDQLEREFPMSDIDLPMMKNNGMNSMIWWGMPPWRQDPVADYNLQQVFPVLRANTVVTPVFKTVIVENGVAEVDWVIPATSSDIELRVYAVGQGPDSFAHTVVKQKVISSIQAMPTLPSMVRVGDKFEGGLELSWDGNLPQEALEVKLVNFSGGAVELESASATQAVTWNTGAKSDEAAKAEVNFAMRAAALGTQSLIMVISSEARGEIDRVNVSIRVLGARTELHRTSAVDILGTANNPTCPLQYQGLHATPCPWGEGIALPTAADMLNISHLKLRVGPSYKPVVQSMFDDYQHLHNAIKDTADGHHPSVIELLGTFASYAVQTPPMHVKAVHERIEELASGLEAMTSHDYNQGVHYSSWSIDRNYDSVDIHLNAVAALVMRRVQSGIKDLWKMLILAKKKGDDSTYDDGSRDEIMKYPPHAKPRHSTAASSGASHGSQEERPHDEFMKHPQAKRRYDPDGDDDVRFCRALSQSIERPGRAVTRGLAMHIARMFRGDVRKDSQYWDVVAFARLARGKSWSFKQESHYEIQRAVERVSYHYRWNVTSEVLEEASAIKPGDLVAVSDQYSPFARAVTAINVLLGDHEMELLYERLPAEGNPADATALLLGLSAYIRAGHHTAYVVKSPGDYESAGLLTNSLVLDALALHALALGENASQGSLGAMHEQMFKIARHVTDGVERAGRSAAGIFAAIALADLDRWVSLYGNQQWDSIMAKVMNPPVPANESGEVAYMQNIVGESFAPVPSVEAVDLMPHAGAYQSLMFQALGGGQATAAVSARYVPAHVPDQKQSSGLHIERAVELIDMEKHVAVGGAVTEVPLGRLVKITIHLYAPVDIPGVVIEEWYPAGLDIFHNRRGRRTRTQFEDCLFRLWGNEQKNDHCSTWFAELKSDRVVRHAAHIQAGSHSLSYVAVATTKGEFAMPPVHAWSVMDAGTKAMSGQQILRVVGPSTQGKAGHALPVPQSCPHDCQGRGVCQTETGTCQCYPGFVGEDCSGTASRMLRVNLNSDSPRTLVTYVNRTGKAEEAVVVRSWDAVKDREVFEELHYVDIVQGQSLSFSVAVPTGRLQALSADLYNDSFGNQSWMSDIELDEVATDIVNNTFRKEQLSVIVDVSAQSVTIKALEVPAPFGAFMVLTGTVDGHIVAKTRMKLQVFQDCAPRYECKGTAQCKVLSGRHCFIGLSEPSTLLARLGGSVTVVAISGFSVIVLALCFVVYKKSTSRKDSARVADRSGRRLVKSPAEEEDDDDGYGKMDGIMC